jgi:hypothetical protein
MVIRRGEREQTLTVRAEAAPETPARDEKTVTGRNPFEGATVLNLSPAVAQDLNIDPFAGKGVLVSKIGQGFALNAGLRPGVLARTVNTSGTRGFYSEDGGGSWTLFPSSPYKPPGKGEAWRGPGQIAVSAKGGFLLWVPEKEGAQVSTDKGRTWKPSANWPPGCWAQASARSGSTGGAPLPPKQTAPDC